MGKMNVPANRVIAPRYFCEPLLSIVKRGGKLVVFCQAAHLDVYAYNVMNSQ